jgi:hypothetical protein
MKTIKTYLSNIATISPRSIGYLIIIGGWEPIYQILRLFKLVGEGFSGFFITASLIISAATFIFDYLKLKKRSKRQKYK